jgi:hypothetical protein
MDKQLFTMKIGQKSINHPREVHILARLDIIMLYISFLRFLKISRFGSKERGVSFQFYRKCDEN